MPYFGAFWLDLDASNSLKSSKEYITNITFGYLCRHVSCSGRNFWRASFLNSTSRKVLPSGLRKLSSGIPLHPFFSFFQQTHPHARACERHCFSRINSSCFIARALILAFQTLLQTSFLSLSWFVLLARKPHQSRAVSILLVSSLKFISSCRLFHSAICSAANLRVCVCVCVSLFRDF